MPKFNRHMIAGNQDRQPEEQPKETEERFQVGAGLLSEASKDVIKMNIEHISRDKIDKNSNNKFSINSINSMAWSIKVLGLLQPLHAMKKKDGRYLLLGGHRRLTAIDQLIQDPDVQEWNEDTLIPVVVKSMDDIDLPLSDEMKERLSVVETNREARKYTDADRLLEIREWKAIVQELRKAGVTTFPSIDEDGEDVEIAIKGEKTRDILAKATGVSRSLINSFEKVENNGSEGLIDALMKNEITVKSAGTLIDQTDSPEEQEEILQKLKSEDKEFSAGNITEITSGKEESDELTYELSETLFEKDMSEIFDYLKTNKVILKGKECKEYDRLVKKIKKLMVK